MLTCSAYPPGILSDKQIGHLALTEDMINPFLTNGHVSGKISSGLSSYGYDARLAGEFKTFAKPTSPDTILDPKVITPGLIETTHCDDHYIVPPLGFVLAHTVEYFKIPTDVLVFCVGKSTYARQGIQVLVTPLEPGFEGQVTLEIQNTTAYPSKIYVGEGICQFLFLKGSEPCVMSYADKGGKYMGQKGTTPARIL